MIDRIAGYNALLDILDYKNSIEANNSNERKAKRVNGIDVYIGDKRKESLRKFVTKDDFKNSQKQAKTFEEILKSACEKLAKK